MRKQRYGQSSTIWPSTTCINKSELDKLKILETKRTNKDNIIYIATEKLRDIGDIYARKAECQSDDTISEELHIPPQFFDCFNTLNKLCIVKRQMDNRLKTQIRFGEKDLEVMTKIKGMEELFKQEDLKSFIGDQIIPDFNFNLKWRIKMDSIPRRRLHSASHGPAEQEKSPAGPARAVKTLVRQHSKEEQGGEQKEDKDKCSWKKEPGHGDF